MKVDHTEEDVYFLLESSMCCWRLCNSHGVFSVSSGHASQIEFDVVGLTSWSISPSSLESSVLRGWSSCLSRLLSQAHCHLQSRALATGRSHPSLNFCGDMSVRVRSTSLDIRHGTLRMSKWRCLCVFRICSIMSLTPQAVCR